MINLSQISSTIGLHQYLVESKLDEKSLVCDAAAEEIRPDFSIDNLRVVLSQVKRTGSTVPETIPAIFLLSLFQKMADVVSYLFELSYNSGFIPAIWKQAHVTPIFKNKWDLADPLNYRQLSVTCLLSRVIHGSPYKFNGEDI